MFFTEVCFCFCISIYDNHVIFNFNSCGNNCDILIIWTTSEPEAEALPAALESK